MSFSERVNSQFKELLVSAGSAERVFRQEAWAKYAQAGLPNRKSESWKYTSLQLVSQDPWDLSPNISSPAMVLPQDATDLMSKWSKEFSLCVTVDGVLRLDLSTASFSGGEKIQSSRTSSPERPMIDPLDFGALGLSFEDGWTALVAALARPGFQIDIRSNPAKPILILNIQTSASTWSPSVNRISLAKGVSADIAEIHLGVDQPYLRSELTSVDLQPDSVLHWVRVQREKIGPIHFSEVQAHVQSGAQFNVTQLHGGAGWCRSSLRADILGERAAARLSGLTFARGRQHIDQRVEVRHAKGFSESSQLFKGVLKDHSRGVMNGKILIEKNAQKVSSMQLNHNLLLSKFAEADTKPELEIHADDVKANHGASIGRLDEDKVFYLMSRGITRALALQMLAHAFVGDVLMKIEPPLLRRFADDCVQSWLPDFSADMEQNLSGGN